MMFITTWIWGTKYGCEYIDRLEAGVKRWYRKPYEWRVFTPNERDLALTRIPGCFARLRMFDPEWQEEQGIKKDDRIVCMDLDSIVVGPLEHVFSRPEGFVILGGANTMNPCPFNGSLMMLRAGKHADIWADFSLDAVKKIKQHEYPDDQGWIWHKFPKAPIWKAGPSSGVYAFEKIGWPRTAKTTLPSDAKLVVFPGWRDPSKFVHLPWIQEHWIAVGRDRPTPETNQGQGGLQT